MMKTTQAILLIMSMMLIASPTNLSIATTPGDINQGSIVLDYRNITVYAPAVAQTNTGYVGVISTITVTLQGNGSGRVFVDTLPLTQIDMQGSARLAVKVASTLAQKDEGCELNPASYDYFFVIRTSAPIIGGPSAGGIMTVAVTALLLNRTLDNKTVMTGMINPDGSIGPIGGIIQKCDAAYSVGATRFLIPKGQNTYTETITETTIENGWTQIRTRLVQRNVSDYAQQQYGMDVQEVEDIYDALFFYTGWDYNLSETNQSISTEDYVESMKPLATDLLNQAQQAYTNASNSFNTSTIPNRFPTYYRNQITDYLNAAQENLQEAETWYDENLYYTSTSNSFQSLIDSRFVTAACDYFESEEPASYVQNILDETETIIDESIDVAKNSPIQGMISLQCVGAAQNRALEASTYFTEAKQSYIAGDALTALYKLMYAQQRSASVSWWIGIGQPFTDTGNITSNDIQNLTEEYISDAQQAIVYSSVIIDEIGTASLYLSDAESLLESAKSNKEDGFTAAALIEALEALVKANLALEIVDGVTEDKVERARESASISISESRSQGIEPVLAVSYYEYGQSLVNESSIDLAIVYYKYAGLIAGALIFTTSCLSGTSRYIGIPVVSITWIPPNIAQLVRYSFYFILIGGLAGLGIGLLVAVVMINQRERKIKKQTNG